MMATLGEFCQLLEKCALRLDEEIKNSFEICRKNVMFNKLTDTKLALEKAKDYHSKEIILLLSGIITNIKQILYHENKIKQLNNKEKLSEEEQNKYSYVKRQVSAFSGGERVVRRELRRVASENSVYYLDTWEKFLKEEEDSSKQLYTCSSLPNINIVPKRHSPTGKRKQKKLISSTFEGILEDDEVKLIPMDMLSEETITNSVDISLDLSKSSPEINCDIKTRKDEIDNEETNSVDKIRAHTEYQTEEYTNNFDNLEQVESLTMRTENNIHQEVDTKPRIVGFVIKKDGIL